MWRNVFNATTLPCSQSNASYTTPMPPAPSFLVMRKRSVPFQSPGAEAAAQPDKATCDDAAGSLDPAPDAALGRSSPALGILTLFSLTYREASPPSTAALVARTPQ